MKFDILIKGGHVVDPAAGYDGKLDVAINRNRIAAVDANIPLESGLKIIEAKNQYVTPGLIDLHAHVYHGVERWGINADSFGPRTGVTSWIDAGSAGAYTVQGFHDFIVMPATVRIHSFLNIVSAGMVGGINELPYVTWSDAKLFKEMVAQYCDIVVGVKVVVGKPNPANRSLEALGRARQLADICGLPIMVHIAWSPPTIEEVVQFLKPGDILTHSFTGLSMRIVDDDGSLREPVKRAVEEGLVLDIAHGKGSFSFDVAEALLASGVKPDVISTDAHQTSVAGPMFDLPTCMSKFLHLGLSFQQVIAAVTEKPAKVAGLGNETGTVRPGAIADIALFEIEEGHFPLYDTLLKMREAKRLIRNTQTIVNGRLVHPGPLEPPPPHVSLTQAQRRYYETMVSSSRESPAKLLDKPEYFGPAVPIDRGEEPLPHERSSTS
jgi:dihydroorotase